MVLAAPSSASAGCLLGFTGPQRSIIRISMARRGASSASAGSLLRFTGPQRSIIRISWFLAGLHGHGGSIIRVSLVLDNLFHVGKIRHTDWLPVGGDPSQEQLQPGVDSEASETEDDNTSEDIETYSEPDHSESYSKSDHSTETMDASFTAQMLNFTQESRKLLELRQRM